MAVATGSLPWSGTRTRRARFRRHPVSAPICVLVVDPAIDTAALEYLQQPGLAPGEVVAIAVEPHLPHVVAAVEALRRTGYTDAVVSIGQFDHEDERIAILDAGADYALDLLIEPRELGAWVRACCRRLGRDRSDAEPAGPPEHTARTASPSRGVTAPSSSMVEGLH